VREVVEELAARHGEPRVVQVCTALLLGGQPEEHEEVAVGLSVHGTSVEQLRSSGYGADFWWPTWAARGLLYVWAPHAVPAVVHGLDHPHWRPAEMCLKVAARREVAEASEGSGALAVHMRPRVRVAALRALGGAGHTEHVPVVERALDDVDEAVRRAAGLAMERMVRRLDLPGSWLP
jgi:hypothetical protein